MDWVLKLAVAKILKRPFWPWQRSERSVWRVGSRGPPPGGTDLKRGYGDVQPWRPPFHAPPTVCKGPILSKIVSSQDPLLRKFGNFSLNSLNFRPNFSSQAPKFGNFQLASPQIWKFSVHKPPNLEIFSSQAPFSEANSSSQAPHFGNPGRTPLPVKKLSAPPGACLRAPVGVQGWSPRENFGFYGIFRGWRTRI